MAKSMIERLREERQAMKNKSAKQGGSGFLKLPKTDEAEAKIRILPAKNWYESDTPDLFYKRFGIHWINGQRVVCPKHTNGDACPICETVNEMYSTGEEEDAAAAKEFKVKKRIWVNCSEITAEGFSEPKVFEFGIKLLDNILAWCVDEDYYDLSDPKGGYDFRVLKVKKDGFPNYDASKPVKKSSEIPEAQMKEWLEKASDIHTVITKQVKTYDEIKTIFEVGGSVVPETEVTEEVDQEELLNRINKRLSDDEE